MMKPEVVKLEGEKREAGKKISGRLRKEKRVPSVLYGPGIKENVHFHVSELELEKVLSVSKTQFLELRVNGETWKTLLKRVEYDPVTDRPLHADFYVMEPSRPVTLRVPVRLTGTAVGVTDGGGRVFQPMRIVRVKALPDAIPAQFEVDITKLGIGDAIHVSELDMEGITPLDEMSRAIVTITPPKSESLFETSVAEELPESEVAADEAAEAGEAAGGEADEGTEAES